MCVFERFGVIFGYYLITYFRYKQIIRFKKSNSRIAKKKLNVKTKYTHKYTQCPQIKCQKNTRL